MNVIYRRKTQALFLADMEYELRVYGHYSFGFALQNGNVRPYLSDTRS